MHAACIGSRDGSLKTMGRPLCLTPSIKALHGASDPPSAVAPLEQRVVLPAKRDMLRSQDSADALTDPEPPRNQVAPSSTGSACGLVRS
jgi:hypothetical protein